MIAHPIAPHNGTDTSEEAAVLIEPHLQRLQRVVLEAIRAEHGCTCDRAEEVTGLSHQTTSARFNALAKAGLIMDTGERRKTRSGRRAAVYRAVTVQTALFP